MTRLLAFDTSTEAMSIAVCLPARTLVFEGAGGALASERLIPEIHALMAQAELSFAQIDAVAFGRGPGAFTGLRTACAVAQGLAFGSGKPVLPIDSLMLVAQEALAATGARDGFDLWVAMDARMDEVYAARYEWTAARWLTTAAPALYTLPALQARWLAEPPRCVAGNARDAFGDRLPCGAAQIVPMAQRSDHSRAHLHAHSRAQALAQLARAAWAQGEAVDVALALPVYLRDKVAQTTAERDAVRAARSLAA